MKWLACTLTLAVSTLAAEAPPKPKSRTLQEMITLTVDSGKDGSISSSMSVKMGLSNETHPTKRIRFPANVSPDKIDHSFDVMVKQTSNGRKSPESIIVGALQMTKVGEAYEVDGIIYYASITGKLLKVFHNHGKTGDLHSDEISVSKGIARKFRQELDFHMKDSVQLGLDFTK